MPLILVPLLMRWLPESAVFAGEKQAAPPLRALFAPETATATLLLWLCYFFTLLVVYMLINWLPLLLVEQGFQPSQAAGGDVCTANGCGERDVNVGRIDG